MGDRALQVATIAGGETVSGEVKLSSHDNGVRWVVRMRFDPDFDRARLTAATASDAPAGENADTELTFVGDTEAEAFKRAEGWLAERYDVTPASE